MSKYCTLSFLLFLFFFGLSVEAEIISNRMGILSYPSTLDSYGSSSWQQATKLDGSRGLQIYKPGYTYQGELGREEKISTGLYFAGDVTASNQLKSLEIQYSTNLDKESLEWFTIEKFDNINSSSYSFGVNTSFEKVPNGLIQIRLVATETSSERTLFESMYAVIQQGYWISPDHRFNLDISGPDSLYWYIPSVGKNERLPIVFEVEDHITKQFFVPTFDFIQIKRSGDSEFLNIPDLIKSNKKNLYIDLKLLNEGGVYDIVTSYTNSEGILKKNQASFVLEPDYVQTKIPKEINDVKLRQTTLDVLKYVDLDKDGVDDIFSNMLAPLESSPIRWYTTIFNVNGIKRGWDARKDTGSLREKRHTFQTVANFASSQKVLITNDGKIHVFNPSGVLEKTFDEIPSAGNPDESNFETIIDGIIPVDLNQDSKDELIVFTLFEIYLLNSAGKIINHFPVKFNGHFSRLSKPLVVENLGELGPVLFYIGDNHLNAISLRTGESMQKYELDFPPLSKSLSSFDVGRRSLVLDINKDKQSLVASRGPDLFYIELGDDSAKLLWTDSISLAEETDLTYSFEGSDEYKAVSLYSRHLTLSDLDRDGSTELIVGTNQSRHCQLGFDCLAGTDLRVFSTDGKVRWSKTVNYSIKKGIRYLDSSYRPIIGDLNNDSKPDILVVAPSMETKSGIFDQIQAYDGKNGTLIFQKDTACDQLAPALGNFDNDSNLELSMEDRILDLDAIYTPDTLDWPMQDHDIRNSSTFINKY